MPTGSGTSRLAAAAVTVILGGCAVVALGAHVLRPSLWRDEAVTAGYLRLSWQAIWANVTQRDASSTAYYQLAKSSTLQAEQVRYLSVAALAAVVMIVTAALAARVGRLAGVFAGLVLLGSPLILRYAQEARSAAVVCLVAALATIVWLQAWKGAHRGWWAGYVLTMTCLGLLQFTALSLVAGHGVLAIAMRRKGMPWRAWLVSLGAVGALVSPLLLLLIHQRSQLTFVKRPDLMGLLSPFSLFAGGPVPLAVWGGVLLLALVLAAAPSRSRVLAVAGLGLAPLGLLAAVSMVVPLYTDRYALFALPAVAAALGVAVQALTQRHRVLGLVAAAAVIAVAAWGIHAGMPARAAAGHTEDLRTPSRLVAQGAQSGDGMVFAPGMWRLARYAYPADYAGVTDVALGESTPTDRWFPTAREGAALSDALRCHQRVWVLREVRAPGVALDPEAQRTLDLLRDWPTQTIWQHQQLELDLRSNPDPGSCADAGGQSPTR